MEKEELANRFLLELIYFTHHIENISRESTNIGSGIFILNVIDSNQERFMKDIVETLNLGPSTATRQIDALVKQGLIKRKTAENDRRKVSLSLTEEGKKIYHRFKIHLIEVMSSSLQIFSEKQINQAIDVFHAIIETSEKILRLKEIN